LCRYDKFSFDITAALEGHPGTHQHEITVQVFDPTGDITIPPADVYFIFI